ncbi:DUF6174 domain-containing protein [Marinobacter sp. SS21]|uniref:DUF6174 domain-containing protein n=1 Tax=Marinobacter sp. SS21 TaxID=2979460 RepID=UPI00232F1CFF|nr:DUF6174 domain-containing protein [Marinobacter sp. SS21]MDC0663661.1 DUF6174 domain-containing protein [Marinobacter sp. SS21]
MKTRSFTIAALTLLAGVSGCSGALSSAPGISAQGAPETLADARERWRASQIGDYQITVQQSCFCLQEFTQPLRITVRDARVVSVAGLTQPLTQPDQLDRSRLTVEGLFDFIADAQRRQVERLDVSYHPQYGYPSEIAYDGHAMIADDEISYRLSDLVPE